MKQKVSLIISESNYYKCTEEIVIFPSTDVVLYANYSVLKC